jgi:hypothetical protein
MTRFPDSNPDGRKLRYLVNGVRDDILRRRARISENNTAEPKYVLNENTNIFW